jgi:cytochrome c oxidase subunit 2
MKRLLILPAIFLLSGCNVTILNPKSVTGEEQAFLIRLSLIIMSVVVLAVFILLIWFIRKYYAKRLSGEYVPSTVHGNTKLEVTWTLIPIILLAVLAVPTIAITYHQSPVSEANAHKDGVHVDVIAEQFQWTFVHENDKKETNELVIPEGESIIFHLRSKDVIHSFWIPELAGKVDVMPHKELVYEVEDPEIGTYEGKCAEYCGMQHANMRFETKVVSKADYENYLEEE